MRMLQIVFNVSGIVFLLSFGFISCKNDSGSSPLYKDAKAPMEDRVKDLLARMTLEEKIAQTQCIWLQKKEILDDSGNFSADKTKKFLPNGVGQIARPSEKKSARAMAEYSNKIQKYFIEQTRLGIPVVFHEECLHGLAAPNATSFPQPIALASSWNTELVNEIFTFTAEECRSRGGNQALTPVVDVSRDPRWGRVEETYGEDPYLCSMMGLAAVNGFQGPANTGMIDHKHVASTLKHFAVHSQPESGTNCAPGNFSERQIREVFFPSFKKCVQEGKVSSVMTSYNEIDGIPSHSNKWLVDQVLRKEWGFSGFIVSDYFAIKEMHEIHGVAKDRKEAAMMAMNTGIDTETPDIECYNFLKELVEEGKVRRSTVDTAVARILRIKFRLGLFDNPYVDPARAEAIENNPENRKLALKAAQQSIILLKNVNNTVPLDRSKIKKLAVIGPNADKCILGGYSDAPKYRVTPLQAIKEKLGSSVEVLYSEGCKITREGGSWYRDDVYLSDPKEDAKLVAEAAAVAKKADVIVLFVGGNEETSREGWAKNHLGDRAKMDLVGMQNELMKQMLATGKPVIVFLNNGAPLTCNFVNDNAHALFECWYLGQETGYAVADVLFGDVNPGGKLPITLPKNEGQIPVFYNHKPSARRGYVFDEIKPMYPFGFGLSYTTFSMSEPKLAATKIKKGESVKVSVEVTNTGTRKGDEVVQLYIRDLIASVTRPVKELKGFQRISLEPGETKTVTLELKPEDFAFYNRDMKFEIEPGFFDVMVGSSSDDYKTVKLEVIE